jgi:hypothetical protein
MARDMPFVCQSRKGEREGNLAAGPTVASNKKCYNSQTKKTKLNFDCTIKFVSINPSKLDLIWIYLDKVTSGSHNG